jgi:hypothetical protein
MEVIGGEKVGWLQRFRAASIEMCAAIAKSGDRRADVKHTGGPSAAIPVNRPTCRKKFSPRAAAFC